MEKKKLCVFSKQIKLKLVDIEQSQEWLMLPMLKDNYDLVTKAGVIVQEKLNKLSEIGLKAQSAAFDSEQARKVDSYNSKIFISNNAVIKPKVMHTINKNTDDALKSYGIGLDKKPTIVIVSEKEMATALGKYDAIKNEVYYIPQIADNKVVSRIGSVEYHEMYHCKQANDFIQATGKSISANNYSEYIQYTCEKSKNQLDKLGITKYNVSELSNYAKNKYLNGRFDETIAEFIVSKYKRKRGEL